jgi:hypothetical protein
VDQIKAAAAEAGMSLSEYHRWRMLGIKPASSDGG